MAEPFEAFIGNCIVIGHAITYDLTVLQREYNLAGRPWPKIRGLDVRLLARIAAPSLADYDLDRLCAWLAKCDHSGCCASDGRKKGE